MTTSKSFNEKVALVTGANRGIGLAICKSLYSHGFNIVLSGRNIEELIKINAKFNDGPNSSLPIRMDVTNDVEISESIAEIIKHFGRIDILVNNAGINSVNKFIDLDIKTWDQIFEVNIRGTFLVTRTVVPFMIEQGRGKVINISSQAGRLGEAYNSAYCASKFAVIGLTQALAQELSQFNICVNAICPGSVETDMMTNSLASFGKIHEISPLAYREQIIRKIPLGRFLMPEQIADVVMFLASDASNGITGASIPVTNGSSMY